MENKSSLRQKMRSMLQEFCADKNARNVTSQTACDIFLSSQFYKNAELVCAFCSMANEIETRPIIERALQDGKSVAVPRVVPNTSDMDFYILEKAHALSEQLVSGEFGILEPCADLQKLDISQIVEMSFQRAIFLVPGIAFDKSGARLGKGKGFYDKYFSRIASTSQTANESANYDAHQANTSRIANPIDFLRVGFCFPFQVVEQVPSEPHDVRMTYIVSDKIITCS